MSTADQIIPVAIVGGLLGIVGGVIFLILAISNHCDAVRRVAICKSKDDELNLTFWEACLHYARRILYISAFLLILGILIPTKNTLIAMLIARSVTEERLCSAVNAGVKVKDELKKDLLEILTVLKDDQQKKGDSK